MPVSSDLHLASLDGHGSASAAIAAFSKFSQDQDLAICIWHP